MNKPNQVRLIISLNFWRDKERHYIKKDIVCIWIGRNNIVKLTTLTKAIYIFNAISMKIAILVSHRKIYSKIYMESQRPQLAKIISGKKNNAGAIAISE